MQNSNDSEEEPPFVIDMKMRTLTVDGQKHHIPNNRSHQVLASLVNRFEKLCSYDDISREVWPDYSIDNDSVDRQIRRTRKLLDEYDLSFLMIKKVSNGYSLCRR
jgi:DNA-binding winged helix-turn-helix (wHTH) protein